MNDTEGRKRSASLALIESNLEFTEAANSAAPTAINNKRQIN